MANYGYYYLGEMVKAIFGMKSVGVEDRANNILADKKHIFNREKYFDKEHEVKFKEVFEVAFKKGAKFIHNSGDDIHIKEAEINSMQIARNFNTFILKNHAIDIPKTYSSGRNINFDMDFVGFIKELIFDLISEIIKFNNSNKLRSELGFWIFSYIFEKLSNHEKTVKFYGDNSQICRYIVRYDFKNIFYAIYENLIFDWTDDKAVTAVYNFMHKFRFYNENKDNESMEGFGITSQEAKESIVKTTNTSYTHATYLINDMKSLITEYNELHENSSDDSLEILEKAMSICSSINPYDYYDRDLIITVYKGNLTDRSTMLMDIFKILFGRKRVSLKEIYIPKEDGKHSSEIEVISLIDSDFKSCDFTEKYYRKFIEIIRYVFFNKTVDVANEKTGFANDYDSRYDMSSISYDDLIEKINSIFEEYGIDILGNASENADIIMLNVLIYVVAPSLFNVTKISNEEEKKNIDTLKLFKDIADYLIDNFNIYPFRTSKEYFKYRYYNVYRYMKNTELFNTAAKETESIPDEKRKNNNALRFDIDKLVDNVILMPREDNLTVLYNEIGNLKPDLHMLSKSIYRLKLFFIERFNKQKYANTDEEKMALILLKIILFYERFSLSAVDGCVEVKKSAVRNDKFHEKFDLLKEPFNNL